MKNPCTVAVFLFLFAVFPGASAQQHRFVQLGNTNALLFPVSITREYGQDGMDARPIWTISYDLSYAFPLGRFNAETRLAINLNGFELRPEYSEAAFLAHPELSAERHLYEPYGFMRYVEPGFFLGKTFKINKDKNAWWEARLGTGVRFSRPRQTEGGRYQLDPLGNPFNYDLHVVMNYRGVTPVLYGGVRQVKIFKNGFSFSCGLELGVPLLNTGTGWYRFFEGETIESGANINLRGTSISVRIGTGFRDKKNKRVYKQEIVIPSYRLPPRQVPSAEF